ncbi:Response regulator PleD [Bacillus sp. THAF10]|uniref:sensor domain-containing diguanylate cyclase n=1 Tax=Bacillus sp. THAF10 TaxID=2587848 RepID=UPI0012A7E2D9|nr:sensor domain-containing diguanylate cyclase [Bacillus sp. THAF10]QFT90071.1 Response regulator PleD [Bacillus sp. THAF10]
MVVQEVSRQKEMVIWTCFFILVPAFLWLGYQLSPVNVNELPIWHLVGFTALAIILSFIPIVVGEVHLFLTQGVSLAVLLSFGLFAEMVITLISVVALMLYIRINKDTRLKIPINMLMFSGISLVAGFTFYALGGEVGDTRLWNIVVLIPILAHEIIYLTLNQVGLYFIQVSIYRRKSKFITADTKWDLTTSIMVLPVGLILYTLYEQVGVVALLYVGLPFVILTLILQLYHTSQKVNGRLQQAADVGHQLTERLDTIGVLDVFIEKVSTLFNVDYAAIIDVNENNTMKILRVMDNENLIKVDTILQTDKEELLSYVLKRGKSVCYEKKKEWLHIGKNHLPSSIQSVMCVPVIRNHKVEGLVLLASSSKRIYEKSQLMILDILCSYFGVAMEKARNYQETKNKSERCALTKLYNYRFFEGLLDQEFEKLTKGNSSSLSLIMLDLDHFKKINDVYGHQSGNEILMQVAERLTTLVGNKGTVARYGGEEFVILLPNIDRGACFDLAEKIRVHLATRSFPLKQHIRETQGVQLVKVTASIGFATAPNDAEDTLDLIRHADRAMYVGAKQAGRNKVAEYKKTS